MYQSLETLERYFGARYSPDTVSAALGQARRFLTAMAKPPPYTRADVLGYVDALVRAGYRPKSIQTITGHVKTLFLACGWTWPLDRRALHLGMPAGEAETPMLPIGDIGKLIAGARQERGLDSATVALATTWGLRSTELASVLRAGMDGKLLVAQTAKGGEVRRHTIPPVLAPYLASPPQDVTREYLHRVFDRVMLRWCRPPAHREGWHSVRRAVVTYLMDTGIEELAVYRFMGWKRSGMIWRYWDRDPARIDGPIYPQHPFLVFWRGK